MIETPEHSDLRTCQDFFCVYFLCLGDLECGLVSGMTGCLIPAAVQSLYSSRGVAKSPALAYSLEESDQVKNNFKEFLLSQLCVSLQVLQYSNHICEKHEYTLS